MSENVRSVDKLEKTHGFLAEVFLRRSGELKNITVKNMSGRHIFDIRDSVNKELPRNMSYSPSPSKLS